MALSKDDHTRFTSKSLEDIFNPKYCFGMAGCQLDIYPYRYVEYILSHTGKNMLAYISDKDFEKDKWAKERVIISFDDFKGCYSGYYQKKPVDILRPVLRTQYLYRIHKPRVKKRVFHLILNLLQRSIAKEIVYSNYIFFQKVLTYLSTSIL